MAEYEKDTELDVLFAAARRDTDRMSEPLMARMVADAARVQEERAAHDVLRPEGTRPGFLTQLLSAIGGWPAMGGLVAACAAGVWIGLSPPEFLPDPTNLLTTTQSDVNVLDAYSLSSLYLEDG